LNKKLIMLGTLLAVVLTASAFSTPASAALTSWSGKGAVAQWYITTTSSTGALRTHYITAVVMMDNAGKDGWIYVSIIHRTNLISSAGGPVEFKWNMDHVSIEATLEFSGQYSGDHVVLIDWQTEGATSNGLQTIPTDYGMTTTVNGALKLGTAQMILDPTPIAGQYNHQDGYPSIWAAIVHGDITVNSP